MTEKEYFLQQLLDMIRLEKELENIKIEISLKEDFNLIDGFGLLDVTGKGFLVPIEMREGLLNLGFRPSIDEVHLVFQRYNRDDDGRLKYSEFSEAFIPYDQHFARLLGTKRLAYMSRPGKCNFDINTLNKYLLVWQVIFDNEKIIENMR